MNNFKIGIQLFTLRGQLKEDFRGCLRQLAEMGYEGVELFGNYGGMEPEQLAECMAELRLSVCGIHVPVAEIINPESNAYRYAKELNCPYLITSLLHSFIGDFENVLADCRKAGEVAAEQGLTFAYHNHAQEFGLVDGQCALDLFYAETSPDQVKAELDTYWIKKGGADPVAYLKKYSDRLPLIHLKDMDANDGSFAAVGTGIIDLQGTIAVARDSVAEWLIYEQDTCPESPLECAKVSIKNIRKAIKEVG